MESTIKIKAGDIVKHIGTDEEWVIAAVSGKYLYPAGWPETCAKVDDCVLIESCSKGEQVKMLLSACGFDGGRGTAAFHNLIDLQPESVQDRYRQLKQQANEKHDAYIKAESDVSMFSKRIAEGEFVGKAESDG